MKKVACYLILNFIVYSAVGQGHNVVLGEEPEAKCIHKQEKKLIKKLKKTQCFSSSDELNFLFIYTYGFKEPPSPEMFLEEEAIEKLKVLYLKNTAFPVSNGFIYNQQHKVVGSIERDNVFCYYESLLAGRAYAIDRKLLDYKLHELPDRIFRIDATPGDLYFAVKDRELKALLFNKDYEVEALNLKDFIECCWEQYFPH